MALAWIIASVTLVSAVSLIGALGVAALRRHAVMVFLIAMAAGTLLGDAFLHLLPEAAHDGFTSRIGAWVLVGFGIMFVVETVLRRGHSHGEHHHDEQHVEPFGVVSLVGDFAHNFLDGIIIAAAYLVDVSLGIATTIAVVLHEVPQELGDFAILLEAGYARRKALLLNLASALSAFIGAGVALAIGDGITAYAVPAIAGGFLYIAAADLVPELHHHGRRHAGIIAAGLLLGLAAMVALGLIEPYLFADAGDAAGGHDGHNH